MTKVSRFIYWTPRILSIIMILFLAMFSLDVFDSCNSLLTCLLALFMHNLPVIILIIVLIISWKREIVGAVSFILAGLLYIFLLLIQISKGQGGWFMLLWSIQISLPAFIIGFLFYLGWRKKKKPRLRKKQKKYKQYKSQK